MDEMRFVHNESINISDAQASLLDYPAVKWTLVVCYAFIFCSCCFGNILVLIVVSVHHSMRSVTNFFLANLAVADLMVGIFCVVQNGVHMTGLSHGQWPLGKIMCHFYVFTLHFVPCASAGILVLLSVERYIAVMKPILAGSLLTKSRLALSTAVVWILCISLNIPYLINSKFRRAINTISSTNQTYVMSECRKNYEWHTNIRLTHTLSFVFFYLLPLLALLYIYISIGMVLWQSTNKQSVVRSSMRQPYSTKPKLVKNKSLEYDESVTEMTSLTSSQRVRNGDERPRSTSRVLRKQRSDGSDAVENRKKVIRLVVAVVLAFAVLCLPRNIWNLWNAWRPQESSRCIHCVSVLFQPISFLMLFANSGINPFLYAFFSERFRAAVIDIVRCRNDREVRRAQAVSRSTTMRQATLTSDMDDNSVAMSTQV